MLATMCSSLFSQTKIISGIINDENDNPLPGVTIIADNTTTGTISNSNGAYTIDAKSEDVLIFSFIGMEPVSVTVGSQTIINVSMKLSNIELDEVIAIGYGSMKKSDLTGAVGSVRGGELSKSFSTDPGSALQGRLAGVTVEQRSGEPGSGSNIYIRGISSLTSNAPYYVIDGIPGGNLSNLNPNDIASIEVLKDAASCAIYGASGGSGVILVTTKGALKSKKIDIEVNSRFGANWQKGIDVLNAQEYAQLISEKSAIANNGFYAPPTWTSIASDIGKGTDWQKTVFGLGTVQDHNFAISGSRNDVSFRMSTGYIGEVGSLNTFTSDKITYSSRIEVNREKWKAGSSLFFLSHAREYASWGHEKQNMMSLAWYNPVLTVNGTLPGVKVPWYEMTNTDFGLYSIPPSYLLDNFRGNSRNFRSDLQGWFELTPWKGFSIRAQGLYGFNNTEANTFSPTYVFGVHRKDWNEARDNQFEWRYWSADVYSSYEKQLNKHFLKLMIGTNLGASRGKDRMMVGLDTPKDVLQSVTLTSTGLAITGDINEDSRVAYFSRFNYSYDNKYLLQATVRRDGTSKFGPGYRWGNFPSASVGWRVSEESFFSPLKSIVSNLKLRAGWGILGNSNIGNYGYVNYIVPTLNYSVGEDQHKWIGANLKNLSVSNLKWEESNQYDFGVDLGLFNNKIILEYSYFDKYSKDLLMQVPVPVESGFNVGLDGRSYQNPYMNSGEVRNWGHEFNLTYNSAPKNEFRFNINLNASIIKNEVLAMGYEGQAIFGGTTGYQLQHPTVIMEGNPMRSFTLIKTDGLFNNWDEINNYTWFDPRTNEKQLIQPYAIPGDVKYIDYNNDGRITDDDMQILGDPFPDLTVGLNLNASYKNFDFSMLFTAVYGFQLINGMMYGLTPSTLAPYGNVFQEYWDNHWTEDHPERNDARYPINFAASKNDNYMQSDRLLDNASYIRLRNVELGYTLPKTLIQKLSIGSVRFYISGQNLLTFTKYLGWSPEVKMNDGCDAGGVPIYNTFYGGVQVKF